MQPHLAADQSVNTKPILNPKPWWYYPKPLEEPGLFNTAEPSLRSLGYQKRAKHKGSEVIQV
jgi:hypothetical protein